MRMIGSKAFGSQHSSNRHVAHICGGGYSPYAFLRLLLEFTQHMLFKFVHPTDKRTGFSETPLQASPKKTFPVQSPGIPIRNAVNEMDIGHFLISVAGQPYSRQKRKHVRYEQPGFYSATSYIQLAPYSLILVHFACK
ncbi:hypothetical protein TNIN_494371 [Trichonephila inaurata madagascariensis]|uniref:Uncharacterized protein n=1 Tax=Trichonephila inaurata madagascariensis TaxID=2747483 RepID=A0A8X6INV2_9ARAC|nr:hypothetical protein TNIN_494371 [Trichonephila inaurata madagascariensis]